MFMSNLFSLDEVLYSPAKRPCSVNCDLFREIYSPQFTIPRKTRSNERFSHLPSAEKEDDAAPTKSTPPAGLSPLYIAMLCVGIPLFVVGVLAGAKRVYAKLWVPEGFPRHRPRRQPSTRRDPVGQEVSMR